ncbi:MAG: NAD(P)H-dependent oxidoreductase [Bacteroidota bacterium]
MQKKILVFGASNSKSSINSLFAQFAASRLKKVDVTVIKLHDFELPLYSVDLEKESGIPENAQRFFSLIKASDGIVASFAEYNGLYTSAFKNLWDWMSRIPMEKRYNIWDDKPLFLLSASPSPRPMNNVTRVSKELFPAFGATIVASFYLNSFPKNFSDNQITDPSLDEDFSKQLELFQNHLNNL